MVKHRLTKQDLADRRGIREQRRRYFEAVQEGKSYDEAAVIAQGHAAKPTAAPHVPFNRPPPGASGGDPMGRPPTPKPVPPKPDPMLGVNDEPAKEQDDLTEIKGVGQRTLKRLNDLGIFSFTQIANWTHEECVHFDKEMALHGRIVRDDWPKQAQKLLGMR
jgi:NADH-quinone oxidoreductase subunit E